MEVDMNSPFEPRSLPGMPGGSMTLRAIKELLPQLASEISGVVNTPYSSYAKTNYVADSMDEVTNVQPAVSSILLMLDDIALISTALDRFSRELRRTVKDHSQLTSAVLRLPVELLAYIFMLSSTLPVDPPPKGQAPYYHREQRATTNGRGYSSLAQVCRKWRDVALQTPKFWNMIEIIPPETLFEPLLITALPAPLTPLARTGTLPAFIFLDLSASSIDTDTNIGHLPVNPACGAVRGLHATKSTLVSLPTLFQWITQFENLTHLYLEDVGLDYSQDWTKSGIAFHLLHRLTHLHMRAPYPWQVAHTIEVQTWHNLRSLMFEMYENGWSFCDFVTIFSHIPNLVELWVVEDAVNCLRVLSQRITSDKLQLFSYTLNPRWVTEEHHHHVVRYNFEFLSFPALVDLVVTAPPNGDVDFIRRFLLQSICCLSSFTLIGDFDDEPDSTPSHLISRNGTSLGEEFAIPSVEFANILKESRIYQEAKDRWFCMDSAV
ncbi:hypothetical protein CONPUDRAFT_134614 [Coniophora puteana RWD-64-598 SS2]|uniref:Uncharacterized protein n=1 Tax=Coniophora puteana (strain RWD-64-598) TaxID=741705 RepID=A0A5M3MZU1_CONPW|nr:uncharacterized protein CONPUDRAFT_134614 [Coniophora puteana RWD-64-598 SS2]EIW84649.1 hypothetical protein CONPUDRAFT_134614 [Coniophora puteana RWD-64-598 SS2]